MKNADKSLKNTVLKGLFIGVKKLIFHRFSPTTVTVDISWH